MDYLKPEMENSDINSISMLGLAHIGDAVYELMTRTMLCSEGLAQASDLHQRTVSLVKAPAQAEAAEKIMEILSEEELAIYKRGRNTHVHSVPHHAEVADYHAATGLEALFGYLYLKGDQVRLNELFSTIHQEVH